jgi:hypothetical protein
MGAVCSEIHSWGLRGPEGATSTATKGITDALSCTESQRARSFYVKNVSELTAL